MSPRARLDSWKAIADFLGRDVRTVIRWEKERGLPVHRVPGGRTRTVYAFSDELQEWMAAGRNGHDLTEGVPPSSETRSVWWRGAMPVLAVALAAAAVTLVAARARMPLARVAADGTTLVGRSADGRELWRHPLGGSSVAFNEQRYGYVGEFDGVPGVEAVATVERVTDRGSYASAIYSFDGTGRIRWQTEPAGRYTFGAGTFSGPWLPLDATLSGKGASTHLIVALHHETWWPSMVAAYDMRGKAHGRFVNAGWISSLTVSPDGRYVLAAGVSNSRNAAVVAVLDARDLSGRSPEDDGGPFACRDCPGGGPLKYFVFPFAEIRRLDSNGTPMPRLRALEGGGYEVRVTQGLGPDRTDEVIYEIDAALALVRQAPSDSYWVRHDKLEREGRIAHSRAQCPEPLGPKAAIWEHGAWK